MRLLEIVRGEKTSNLVIATAMSVARAIGKIDVSSVSAQDSWATECCSEGKIRHTN
jgi:3-hydroxyacyl-CoA dehydrogenase